MASNYSRHKAALPPGARLRQYAIRRVLGVGGFGITYLATDGDLQTQVAIKEYLPNEFAVREGEEAHPKSPESQKAFRWGLSRFLQEGRELAKFRHPHIVRVHQMFEANNTAYMVLDYEGGDTLEKWLRGLGRKPTEAELQDILLPLLGALEHIHQGGLLHRDISPDNIIIRKNGAPALIDFGSARHSTAVQSKTLSAVVKAGYSPPEQYSSRGRQGAYTDIYALAATLYRAITGKAPPEGSWRVAEVASGDGDPLPPLQEVGYFAGFLSAIESALAVSASRRPQNIAEWRKMLNFSTGAGAQTEFAQQPTQQKTPKLQMARVSFGEYAEKIELKQSSQWDVSVLWHTDAQYAFGEVYWYVKGVDIFDERPIEWWLKAAERGDATAQFIIGNRWRSQEAEKWYRKSAEQGNVYAENSLGVMYEKGQEVKQSDQEAIKWYLKAAEKGHARAQYNLGRLYESGRGVKQDCQEAAKWYLNASKQGICYARHNLGMMYESGRGVKQDYQEAAKWYLKDATSGIARAQYSLGRLYETGRGVKQDRAEALYWYRKAAKQGYENANYRISRIYISHAKKILIFLFLAFIAYVWIF